MGFVCSLSIIRSGVSKYSWLDIRNVGGKSVFLVSWVQRERSAARVPRRFQRRVHLRGHLKQSHTEPKPVLVHDKNVRPQLSTALVALFASLFAAVAGVLLAVPSPVRVNGRRTNPALVAAVGSSLTTRGATETKHAKQTRVERVRPGAVAFHDPEGERMARNRLIANIVAGVSVGAIYLYYSDRCKRDAEEEEKRIRAEVARLEKWKSEFVDAQQSSDVSDEDLLAALRERLQQQKEETSADTEGGNEDDSETSTDERKKADDDPKLRQPDGSPEGREDSGKHSGKDVPPPESSRSGAGGATTLDRPGAERGKRTGRGRSMDARSARSGAGDQSGSDHADERDATANWDLERERLRKLFNLDSGGDGNRGSGSSGGSESDDVRKGDR